MELKSRKYINNKKKYPKYWIGTALALVGRNVQGALELANQRTTSSNEIMANQQTTQGNVGGISYDKMDENINEDQYLSQYSNPAIASDLSSLNFVGAFGKMFGGGKRRQLDQIRLAQQKIRNINDAKKSDALQQLSFNEEVEKQRKAHDFYEYAYDGRAPQQNNKKGDKKLIDTAYGKLFGKQNAWVSKDEQIVDTVTGASHKVDRGPHDTAPAYLTGRDAVLSTSKRKDLVNPETGNSFAEDFPSYKASGNLGRLLALNSMVHQNMNNKQKYEKAYGGRSQKYPKCYGGDSQDTWIPSLNLPSWKGILPELNTQLPTEKLNLQIKSPYTNTQNPPVDERGNNNQLLNPWWSVLSSGLQAAGTIGAAYMNSKEPTSNINSYRENAYGRYALDQLGKLRANAQPALDALDRAYIAQSNNIDRNVSLTAGQKLAHKLAASNSINNQRSKILADYQNMNNQYKSNWANAMMQYGQQESAKKMQAYQYDTSYNDKAKAAKRAMQESYRKELSNNLGSLAKNLITTYLANKNYGNYAA